MNISQLHALLDEKIKEVGIRNVYNLLTLLKDFKGQIDFSSYNHSERIALLALLKCPILLNQHIFQLQKMDASNKRRIAQKLFESCNKEQLLVMRIEKFAGWPIGNIVVWYLSFEGYKTTLSSFYPGVKTPQKSPPIRNHEVDHDKIIADIFTEISVGEDIKTTLDRIEKINWLPRHLNYTKIPDLPSDQNILIPDAIIRPLNTEVKIYLEVDRSTKDLKTEKEKLEKYAQYFLENSEAKKLCCLIVYSVDSEARGLAIKKMYDDLKERKDLPELRYYLHKHGGKELRRELNDCIQF